MESIEVPFTIFKDFTFAAAHRIPDHPGECRHLHGHNYRVRVHVRAEELDSIGMVVDFSRLREMTGEIAGRFDHRVINDFPPFDSRNPTAEHLAEFIYQGMAEEMERDENTAGRVSVLKVEVWENDTSCAMFEA